MTSADQAIVLADTNILHSAGMRDILLQLAVADLLQPRWSPDIGHELMRTLRNRRPDIDPKTIENAWKDMNHYFPEAMITGYEHLVDDVDLPDPQDRHILAAAIHGNCNVIVTQNLKDFPAEATDPFGIEVCNADDFFMTIFISHPQEFLESIHAILLRLKSPSYSVAEYLEMRAREGLDNIAAELLRHAHLLD